MATNYDINYNDNRFTEVEADKKAALSEVEKTYGGMINESDKYYQAQIDASKQWADKQSQLQQEQTDFAIEKIEQQKDQAEKDYTKEQSGAYVDWQKQSNQYGANAEQMASQGMQNTGFAESSLVSMYNTYQNRVATAREAYNLAVINYDNAIKEAQLQNNSILAEIAFESLQKQLELSLQGFQYKNQLLLEKADKKLAVDSEYYQRYQDVLKQINTENALAEEVRQFNETMAYNKSKSSGSGSIKKSSGGSSKKTTVRDNRGTVKTHGANAEVDKYINSGENRAPVDTDSLVRAGYAGKSAASIDEAVRKGILIEYVEDGKLKYKKAFAAGGKANFVLKTQTKKKV
jgi:hypothetical protein